MKKIKTLVIALNYINKTIDSLEEFGIIDVVSEYLTKRDGISNQYNFFLKPDNRKLLNLKYKVPYEFYQRFYNKYFSGFYENYSRYSEKFAKLPNYMELQCQFKRLLDYCYNELLEKEVELIIHKNYPHQIWDYIFCSLAKELGIKTLYSSSIPYIKKNIFMIRENYKDLGKYKKHRVCSNITDFDLNDFLCIRKFLMSPSKKHIYNFKNSTNRLALNLNNVFRTRNIKEIKEYENILANIEKNNLPQNIRYAYYPLHYQPEASIVSLGESCLENQSIPIEYILEQLPEDMYIVVKEHYLQAFAFRDPLFYQKLAELKKVIFVSSAIDSVEILKNAEFAITVSGTVGFEALIMGKPVVYAGYPLYQELPGAFRFDENLNINDILNFKYDKHKLEEEIAKYFQTGYEGLTEPTIYNLDCSEEDNIKKLTHAYADYITNMFKNNPEYFERINNIYTNLKKISTTNIFVNEEVQKQINEYLPDCNYFFEKKYFIKTSDILSFTDKIQMHINKICKFFKK